MPTAPTQRRDHDALVTKLAKRRQVSAVGIVAALLGVGAVLLAFANAAEEAVFLIPILPLAIAGAGTVLAGVFFFIFVLRCPICEKFMHAKSTGRAATGYGDGQRCDNCHYHFDRRSAS